MSGTNPSTLGRKLNFVVPIFPVLVLFLLSHTDFSKVDIPVYPQVDMLGVRYIRIRQLLGEFVQNSTTLGRGCGARSDLVIPILTVFSLLLRSLTDYSKVDMLCVRY